MAIDCISKYLSIYLSVYLSIYPTLSVNLILPSTMKSNPYSISSYLILPRPVTSYLNPSYPSYVILSYLSNPIHL